MSADPAPVLAALASQLGDRVRLDAPLGVLTTYRVGGRAAAMVVIDDHEALSRFASVVAGTDIPVMTLGRGSNLLVADDDEEDGMGKRHMKALPSTPTLRVTPGKKPAKPPPRPRSTTSSMMPKMPIVR